MPIDQLTALTGAKPDYLHVYASLRDSLPVQTLDAVREQQIAPMLTLEPWRPGGGTVQPEYSLAALVEGRHDADLTRWADQLGSWGHHILLRFAQEMNGPWYPWSIGVGRNTESEYRAAWSRMHRIVREMAPNVRFVWAPNAITEGTSDFGGCYPGADEVDYLGLDGYNFGASPGHTWQSADKLFSRSIAELERLDPLLPILVTEVGCAEGETPESKAAWIRDFFAVMENSQRIEGFLWFQMDKECDWRFNSTPTSTQAFRDGLAGWIRS
ncbi:glycoside hydrolase family 26 protein [Gordonia sp. SCSIO 19800]|uniref:glycoside hydrolase family 26 protein n=1 Tax=Gordonia sp. SCSIO 19800 TaxID=2826926 RepID=UPI002012A341|nr:glycosyl hydrolase [Gordonia sp. SCSIO 19800]